MDHTPGQGQYRNIEIYERSITPYKGKEIVNMSMDEILAYHKTKEYLSFDMLWLLTDLAHENGIAVASHDDDTVEKLGGQQKK